MAKHVTLQKLVERASRNGIATSGHWQVELVNGVYKFYHWDTLILTINNNGGFNVVYGESKSDADGINAMLELFGYDNRYTFRPVNGGFMRVS